ncbi:TadE/TadG family type IV pilus assembly protein, partial [Nocardioides sp.]|uniref:TadE/TadG family type IV pilus assembly protein n=1 Tax=Nocardioides sp. TaxID=35761 RepID=UPI002F3F6C70
MTRRHRDERGAVAIMVGLLSVVLLSIAALGVDLGNAWAQKRQVQVGSDLAAEAGAGIKGANLPASSTVHSCSYGAAGALPTDQSVKDIASYLASQAYPDNTGAVYSSMLTTLPAQLTDCNMANGEVVYGNPNFSAGAWHVTFNKNQLSLVSPPKTVDFGLAGIMGFHSTNVAGVSTVEIKS